MPADLVFPDPPTASDALTFAQRAEKITDGALRIRATDGVLALTCSALSARTLLEDTPTVIGMRVVPVDPELVCDIVVDAASLRRGDDPSRLVLPETGVTAPWAGISAPRSGWEVTGQVNAADLAARAQWGIAAVAEAVPADAGEDIVHTVRSHVWGEEDALLGGLPRGVAFAAFALGFIAGEETAVIRTQGPWTRVSLARGHVLTRGTVRSGLTGVRRTGG